MELHINTESFERRLDSDTGSVLFYKNFQGIPDKVIHGEGYVIEIKEKEVVIFDIYNPGLVIPFAKTTLPNGFKSDSNETAI